MCNKTIPCLAGLMANEALQDDITWNEDLCHITMNIGEYRSVFEYE